MQFLSFPFHNRGLNDSLRLCFISSLGYQTVQDSCVGAINVTGFLYVHDDQPPQLHWINCQIDNIVVRFTHPKKKNTFTKMSILNYRVFFYYVEGKMLVTVDQNRDSWTGKRK